MKRILIGDNREELLSTLDVILKNWGYRPLCTSDPEEFCTLLKEVSPDLVIAGPAIASHRKIGTRIENGEAPLVLIKDKQVKSIKNLADESLAYPVNIFTLFEVVQKKLEKIPRRNIRLNVQLPSMYYHGDAPCIAEIVSLSSEGIFLRTGSRIEGLDDIRLILPLIGLQTEIELKGRIVYRVEPQAENNYTQGMGIEFLEVISENRALLKQFVESLLVAELTEKKFTRNALDLSQLENYSEEVVLKIQPAN